jgi:ribosomal-protein-alanine N-acetyltransferase
MTDQPAYLDPPLSNSTITLRPWTIRDLPAVEQASHDPYIPATTSVPAVYSDEAGRAWIERQERHAATRPGVVLCIANAATDTPLGLIALWLENRAHGRASFGYWVVPAARGQGAATEAVRLLGGWAFSALGIARLEILVEPHNVASQRVAERADFQQEGLLRSYEEFHGRRLDLIMHSLLATERSTHDDAATHG